MSEKGLFKGKLKVESVCLKFQLRESEVNHFGIDIPHKLVISYIKSWNYISFPFDKFLKVRVIECMHDMNDWSVEKFKMFSPDNCPDTLFQLQMCLKICPNRAGYIVSEVRNYSAVYVTGTCTPLGPAFTVATWGAVYNKGEFIWQDLQYCNPFPLCMEQGHFNSYSNPFPVYMLKGHFIIRYSQHFPQAMSAKPR